MAARFNEAMVARLIELVQSRQDDLNPPTRTAKANEKQKEAWKFVTDSMKREFPQEVPQGGLTIAQIQTKFKNLKQRAKDERQTEKKHQRATGGGKKFEMTEVSRNVSQLFADSPAFEGVPGGVQTGLNIGDTIFFEGKEQEESAEFSSQQVVVEEGKSYAVLGTVPRGEAVKTPKFESSTSRVPFRSRA
ncbi:hypothetical protein niasHS_004356 [Heterodera schachtii]|uniref:Myb/SANT-like DNA-binding domain-containing protein n=1 Tax=Heterodera schachtii TaxID=97005 RepID=A0ABD2K0H2_HETSC